MSSLPKQYYTPEEYLALEREAEYKSEYINGQIYAMSGASSAHLDIAANLHGELFAQLRERPCRVYSSDLRIKVKPIGMYTYPDVTVVCGKPIFEDQRVGTLTNPNVIIEVLSPSTETYDRREKFAHYSRLESLTDYVLVSQDQMRGEHYVRSNDDNNQWQLTELSDPDEALRLPSVGCTVALRAVYNFVEFPTNEPTG